MGSRSKMDSSLQLSVTQTYSQFLVRSYSFKIQTTDPQDSHSTPVYEHSSSLYQSSPACPHNSSEWRRFHPICTVHTLRPHHAQQRGVTIIRRKARPDMELGTFVSPRSSVTQKTCASQCHIQTLVNTSSFWLYLLFLPPSYILSYFLYPCQYPWPPCTVLWTDMSWRTGMLTLPLRYREVDGWS